MKVSVIGAGAFGSAFARAAVKAGHEVTVSSRDLEHAREAAAGAGATAVPVEQALRGRPVVVLAIPGAMVPAWAAQAAGQVDGVVVDATNPLTADFSDLLTEGRSAAERLQELLPRAAVVKAFNTVFSARLSRPVEDGAPLDVLLAGDDAQAKRVVADLAGSLGFTPRDAGRLRMARALEELAFLHISLNLANGWVWQSALQLVGPTAA